MKKQCIYTCVITFLLLIVTLLDAFPFSYEELRRRTPEELLNAGNKYLEENNTDTALIYYITLSGRYTPTLSEQDKNYTIQGFIRAGNIYYEQSIYHTALELYFKALRICESEAITSYLPRLYTNMGNIYNKFKDYEKGDECYKKGLAIAQATGDKEMEWKLLINLVGIYCYGFSDHNSIEQAKIYHEQAKHIPLANDTVQNYYNLFNAGYIFYREKNFDSAAVYYKKALDFALENDMKSRYISSPSSELAFLYEDLERYDLALDYHLFSNDINQQETQSEMALYSLQNLSVLYEKKGDEDKALFYRNQYLSLSDSIFNIREFNRVKNMQMVYEMDKVNQQVDSLSAEKEESELKVKLHRRILIIISISLALVIVLLIIALIQKKKLQGAYYDLFGRNKEILQSDKMNREMRIEYERKLREEKDKTIQLRNELDSLGYKLPEERGEKTEENEHDACKVNKLTEEHKEKIIQDINNVMANTLEYCDCEFSLTRLATLIGSNTKYVSQIINEVYNKNFRTYINEYRIKEASRRLMNTDEYGHYTISAIAESVGFKSPTTFIMTFKKSTGINPSTYQKIAQNDKVRI